MFAKRSSILNLIYSGQQQFSYNKMFYRFGSVIQFKIAFLSSIKYILTIDILFFIKAYWASQDEKID